MSDVMPLTTEMIDRWADDPKAAVALHLRQKLVPVEGSDGVVFPPTYALGGDQKVPYQVDTLSDGSRVVQIDSVGAQANRMEPLFKAAKPGLPLNPLASLVPQIEINLGTDKTLSILDAGHRLGDALVRATNLQDRAEAAFEAWRLRGDATGIARLAPTSLVFGAWDSRGKQAKIARIVQAVIRGWDVDLLTRSAQYNPPVDYASLDVFSDEEKEKAEGDTKNPLAKRGFVPVPATGGHGGVVVRGGIHRDVTVNLVALRQLDGENGIALRRYILGLCLVAAAEPLDGYLRQGCLLTLDPTASHPGWTQVERTGQRTTVDLTPSVAFSYAERSARAFTVGESGTFQFTKERAKADLKVDEGKVKGKKAKKSTE